MGTIQLKFRGITIKFERSDDEVNKFFQQLSGGGIIESHSTQLKLDPIEKTNKISKSLLGRDQNNTHFAPKSSQEVFEFIKSLPNYEHSVKSLVSHFNNREIELDRNNKELFSYWYNIRLKAISARKRIEKVENGVWIEVRDGLGKKYRFEKR